MVPRGRYSSPTLPRYPDSSRSRRNSPIGCVPVPGWFRPGTSAICTCATSGAYRRNDLLLSPRHAEEPALAPRPVARRGIEEHELQPEVLQRLLDARGIERMDEEDLDAPETCLRCRTEAVVYVDVGPEHGEIRGETGHGDSVTRAFSWTPADPP